MDILEPMSKDPVDFVHQGAFAALGMILVQQSEAAAPSIVSTRALYSKTVANKHEDLMARFGAALGQGFIDAGGRNMTISLQSRAGSRNTSAFVGFGIVLPVLVLVSACALCLSRVRANRYHRFER